MSDDHLYHDTELGLVEFGSDYAPAVLPFPHGEWVKVARYPRAIHNAGQDVTVHECRLPARFFKLEIHEHAPSETGLPMNPYIVTTGSGMGEFTARLGKFIAAGRVGFKLEER